MQISDNGKLIDASTGEVIEHTGQVQDLVVPKREVSIADLISTGGEFIHLRKAEELSVPHIVLSSYVSAPSASVDNWIGKPIMMIGGIVYFSGPYTSAKRINPDGSPYIEEGYYKSLIKISEQSETKLIIGDKVKTIRRNVILSTSGTRFAQMLGVLIQQYGWYDGYREGQEPKPWNVPAIIQTDDMGRHLLEIIDPSLLEEE